MKKLSALIILALLFANCNENSEDHPGTTNPPIQVTSDVDAWLTKADQSSLVAKQSTTIAFGTSPNNYPSVSIDTTQQFQVMDGFGFTLTGGSAMLLSKMSSSSQDNLLHEVFGCSSENACISYLRISMGASDLDEDVFSYNDLPAGETDPANLKFSLAKDTLYLIPILKKILAIRPDLKIMASPWSAPLWMKTNQASVGGQLSPAYYGSYANYFVKYIQAMRAHNIPIDAITVQNEPQHGGNNPSMVMSAAEQASFVKTQLGPQFRDAGIQTKIVIWDHNCDQATYPISILNDPDAKKFIDGSAFHLYAGDVSALSQVKQSHPDKNLYFTEQWTGANGSFDGDFKWHTKNVVIGAANNWAKTILEWNLANDPGYRPHTMGGCTLCKGALTLDGSIVQRNVSYYIISQISRFVPPGSVRIMSSSDAALSQTAFLTPDGRKVLLVLNEGGQAVLFNIAYNGKKAVVSIPANAATTYVWK